MVERAFRIVMGVAVLCFVLTGVIEGLAAELDSDFVLTVFAVGCCLGVVGWLLSVFLILRGRGIAAKDR